MEFFYDLISKLKNNYIFIVLFIILIIINDIIITNLFFIKPEVVNNISSEKLDVVKENDTSESLNISSFKIDIKGQVKKPGVYEVDENMNVLDAINLAGGVTKKASTENINLSKKLRDQMVIIIPKKVTNTLSNKEVNNAPSTVTSIAEKNEENKSAVNSTKNTSLSNYEDIIEQKTDDSINNDALIQDEDVNDILITIDSENENKLISINNAPIEKLMSLPGIGESKAKAIIEYRNHNSFSKIEDIKNVSGIGDSLFEKIKDYITV